MSNFIKNQNTSKLVTLFILILLFGNPSFAQTASSSSNLSNESSGRLLYSTQEYSQTTLTQGSQKHEDSYTDYDYDAFVIYEAYTELLEDLDGDGYYQAFSVTFDADVITNSVQDAAVVYAELYLSEDGGPWFHHYTTDSFVIQGESADDTFEIYTALGSDFTANHYYVLIDLYVEGSPYIMASYSSDDSNDLYALPLEGSEYDIPYEEYYTVVYTEETVYGGSNSLVAVLSIFMFVIIRFYKKSKIAYLTDRVKLLINKKQA